MSKRPAIAIPGATTPVVAIIGRPNVGKSTLFNRLTGTRAALVSDIPGLTRDRREGVADLGGASIQLVDTAGLEEAKPGSIADRMRKQSEKAIEDCALVLFVVDSRAGITPTDISFARLVRTSGKPVILVANKAEGRQGTDGFYEAFSLGFGDPLAISAEHGEGLSDLVIDIAAALGLMAVNRLAAPGAGVNTRTSPAMAVLVAWALLKGGSGRSTQAREPRAS